MPTVSVTVLTRFQQLSAATTVTLNALLTVWALGVPVLPETVPGAALSPGVNNCNCVKDPAATAIGPLLLADRVPSVRSLAVTIALPAVFKVTLKICVPEEIAAAG